MSWIVAEPGTIAGLHKSNYIRRDDHGHLVRGSEPDMGVQRTSNYITRVHGPAPGELGAHVLLSRGLPVASGADLARLLDAAERKSDRTYRRYGGRLPRVGSHVIASFPRGVTHEDAALLLRDYAQAVSDRLHVPLEGQVHNKQGLPDHIHLVVGTRVVENGKLKRKCRSLDAVSEKADGRSIDVGDRVVGVTVEWMRADWARRMRDVSEDQNIDHRSYARRGLSLRPVTHVPRAEIEYQRRHGSSAWRDVRRHELTDQNRGHDADNCALGREQDGVASPAPERPQPDTRQVGRAEVAKRAEALLATSIGAALARKAKVQTSGWNDLAVELGLPMPFDAVLMTAALGMVSKTPATGIKEPAPDGPTRPLPSVGTAPPDTVAKSADRATESNHTVHPDRPGDLATAVRLFATLHREHRGSATRTRQLAALAGREAEPFEAVAQTAIDDPGGAWALADFVMTDLPPVFLTLWEVWKEEDNAKRRDRRERTKARGGAQPESARQSDLAGTTTPASARPALSGNAVEATDRKPGANGRRPQLPPEPVTADVAPSVRQPSPSAGSGEGFGSAVLDQALYQAHRADILAIAQRRGHASPSGHDLEMCIAYRLRAAERSRDEVERILVAQGFIGMSAERHAHVQGYVAIAFGPPATAWFVDHPRFESRAKRVDAEAETKTYRALRRDALKQLEADLTAVWVERRLRAEEARCRHEQRLRLLLNIRWGARRLRRRGLLLAILSVAVELAVLGPLIAQQRGGAATEQRALHDRARQLSEELKQRRQAWRETTGHRGIGEPACALPLSEPMVNQGAGTEDGRADATTRAAHGAAQRLAPVLHSRHGPLVSSLDDQQASSRPPSSASRSSSEQPASGAAPSPTALSADARRRLLADVALVAAIRGTWKECLAPLKRAGKVSEQALWSLALEACRNHFGHAKPSRITRQKSEVLWSSARHTARQTGWVELTHIMREMERGGRDEIGR